jgi:hypothetical protein
MAFIKPAFTLDSGLILISREIGARDGVRFLQQGAWELGV